MTDRITRAEAFALFAEAFNEPVDAMTAETLRDELGGWDSMGVLALMAELDDRFEIVLEDDTLAKLNSIADLLEVLEARGVLRD